MRDLLQRLGLAAYGGNYESVRRRLERLGALDERFCPRSYSSRRVLREVPLDDLRRAVGGARSLGGVLSALGLAPSRGAYRELRARLGAEGVDVSHLRRGAGPGVRPFVARIPLEQLLVVGGRTDAAHLKTRRT